MTFGRIALFAVALFSGLTYSSSTNGFIYSKNLTHIEKNGNLFFINKELKNQLDEESHLWHWYPYLKIKTKVVGDMVVRADSNCEPSSADSFPQGIFTDEQLKKGGFLCYAFFCLYAFILLAYVCNNYFIPCVEIICEDLKIPQNVAAATFMAAATSCPEFFVNVISTFLTESDMGIGTIVGSAFFNALGVAAVGSLAAVRPIVIERGPVTRDAFIYLINVSVLTGIVWDGQVDWYEALVLAILYVLYFVIMFNSPKLFKLMERFHCCQTLQEGDTNTTEEISRNKEVASAPTEISRDKEFESAPTERIDQNGSNGSAIAVYGLSTEKIVVVNNEDSKSETEQESIWEFPSKSPLWYKIWWLLTWPIQFVLYLTIPNPVTCRRFYPLSFAMCIIWIGGNSYFVSWSLSVIGATFMIPDSVMGMTFLAFGGCVPEACSIFIMSRRGHGGMGVSNALGANSLAILFALGLPWLIKTVTNVAEGVENPAVYLNSTGIEFVVTSLVIAIICLYITLYIARFVLRKKLGFFLALLYLIFITFAILVEMGVILDLGYQLC